MAHFACITLPALGHINPMAAIARALVARGHKATFFHVADVAPTLRGVDFVPVGLSTHPPGWIEKAMPHAGRLWLGPLMRDAASVTAMLCRDLPDLLRARSVDMILTDQMEAAGGLVAYRLGLPFVSIAAALPMNWEPGVPSPFVGWAYGDSRWHRARNIAVQYAGHKALDAPVSDVIDQVCAAWKLRLGDAPDRCMSGRAQISQLVPELDFPRRSLIGCFHYCGPLRDRPDAGVLVDRGHERGRAFASLGTLQGHRAALFEHIAGAAAATGLDLTVAHGGRLATDDAARLSQRAEVHAFVEQAEIFPAVDVAILHGGLNTVLDALAHGVPIVVIPLAFEQGGVAARVARAGAGRVLKGRLRREPRLAAILRDVHQTPAYAQSASRLRDAIRASGGTARAADIIEKVLATGKPVLRDIVQGGGAGLG